MLNSQLVTDDIILRHLTSFSYIFPYYDVTDKNADISNNFADYVPDWTISGKLKVVDTSMQKIRPTALFVQILRWGVVFIYLYHMYSKLLRNFLLFIISIGSLI